MPSFEMRHRLALALESAGVRISQIAAVCGVSRNTVGNWLAGRTTPRRSDLIAWAETCDVPVGWLETGRFDPPEGGHCSVTLRYPTIGHILGVAA